MDKLQELLEKIKDFQRERDWKKYHNPKDLAISIALEASELLEHFQWKDSHEVNEKIQKDIEKIEEEVGDVLIYLLLMADALNINLTDAAEKKIRKNSIKYPIEKAKGSNKKYTEL